MKTLFLLLSLSFLPGCVFPLHPEKETFSGTVAALQMTQKPQDQSEMDPLSTTHSYSLPDLVDLALRNNPRTRQFWFQSQANAAAVGMERSGYYPKLDIGASAQSSHTAGKDSSSSTGPFATLDALLFDFGERQAQVNASIATWQAALHTEEARVQEVIFQIQTAFYSYVSLRFLARAQATSLKEATVNLDAAQERNKAGVGTLMDVLQAKTALSKVKLSLQSTEGQLMALRGAVFTAAGLPPSAPLDVAELSWDHWPMQKNNLAVESFLTQAELNHPEIRASMEILESAKNKEQATKASRYPKLLFSGRAEGSSESESTETFYSTNFAIRFPLFAGGEYYYAHEKAEAELSVEKEKLREIQQAKAFAVWSDYYAHETAQQQIQTADDLLGLSKESLDVALKRYREGAGSVLDLLSAQSALEEARAAQIQARADWLLSLAKLRYDTGILDRESSLK